MSDTQAQFAVLKQTADPAVVDAISQLIAKGEDRDLNRINLLEFAARYGLDEEKVISAFLHSARLGLFDLTWNVLCPGCGGVLGAHNTLKSLRHDDYNCALCAQGYEASVDEQVEVAFTVSPRVRRIAAHDPSTLPFWEYYRQMFWSSGIELNRTRGTEDLIVKIGLHEGPCLAVMLNERQDYFGQTVNIAARVQSLSTNQEIHITGPVIDAPGVATILEKEAI